MVFLSQLPIFNKDGDKDGHLDDGDEDQGDLSDSEESVFSGLEESGSESDDEDEEDGSEEKSSDVEEDKAADGDGDHQLSDKEVIKLKVLWTRMLTLFGGDLKLPFKWLNPLEMYIDQDW